MEIEKKLIKLIESLDRIMDTWDNLSLRRTIVSVFTIMLFSQMAITTILYVFGREISTNWVGIIGIEFGAWGTILAYYFNIRGKIDEQNIRNNIKENNEREKGRENE